MHANDFRRIIGSSESAVEYAPVALLMKSGYACFGHYNQTLNSDLVETAVLLNARLMEFKSAINKNKPVVEDFREFLLEVVVAHTEDQQAELPSRDELGSPVPLVAVPMDEIAIVYPVGQIVELLRRASEGDKTRKIPTLFDLDKSEILAVLRMKLW